MSRPFEDAGSKGRRWQCFVCGNNFEEYETYKAHILENHEEGREFLKCSACDAPVRCLTTHFKCKHRNRIVPTGVQTRVAVWHDFRPNGKDKKTRKPTFHSGEFDSKKCGKLIHYRSGLERDFYDLLEEDADVSVFSGEPYKVPYYWQGKWHDYVPDLRIDFIDGSTQIWEIKPSSQKDYEQNRAKWGAAQSWAENNGWEFVVQTEEILGEFKHKIKKQRV